LVYHKYGIDLSNSNYKITLKNCIEILLFLLIHNITHGDLKEKNLLVKGNKLKVCDFDGASIRSRRFTSSYHTPGYQPNECFNGFLSDVYSMFKIYDNHNNYKFDLFKKLIDDSSYSRMQAFTTICLFMKGFTLSTMDIIIEDYFKYFKYNNRHNPDIYTTEHYSAESYKGQIRNLERS